MARYQAITPSIAMWAMSRLVEPRQIAIVSVASAAKLSMTRARRLRASARRLVSIGSIVVPLPTALRRAESRVNSRADWVGRSPRDVKTDGNRNAAHTCLLYTSDAADDLL